MAEEVIARQAGKLNDILEDPNSLKLDELETADLNLHRDWFHRVVNRSQKVRDSLNTDLINEIDDMRNKQSQFDELLKEFQVI
jgi:hypothetical protein